MSIIYLDYIYKYFLPIAITILFLFISCHKFDVDEAVDQGYLDAPSYQTFKEASRSESGQSIKGKAELTAFVKQAIRQQATSGFSKTIPFTIDEDYVDRLLKQQEKKSGLTTFSLGGRQRFYYLATAGTPSVSYHFFMLCKVSAYKNCTIGLTTANGGETIDLSLLAPFKRMLTYDEISLLKISRGKINIEIKSQVRYPIEQQNVYGKRYVISSQGDISEAEGN